MKRLYLAGVAVALATVVAIVVAVVAFNSGGGAGAGDTSATAADGTSEGITVHGHWVIEIREPDGSLVTRQEIDNALEAGGRVKLSALLGRTSSMGLWMIMLQASHYDYHPCQEFTTNYECFIVEPAYSGPTRPAFFENLEISRPTSDTLQLRGYAIVGRDGEIATVSTFAGSCGPSTPPSSCLGQAGMWFTQSSIDPINVSQGQEIVVKVTISFS